MMKQINTFIIGLATILLIGGCGQREEEPLEDIVAAYPDNAKIVFDNAYVQAVEFMLKPGEKLPLHKGGARVLYSLSDYTIKWNEGGQVSEKKWQKGDVHWHDAVAHAVENIGETDADYLVVTRKTTALPETGDYDLAQDASQIDTAHAYIVFENEQVRIIEVQLAANESQPEHNGINRMIYALTNYHIQYSSDTLGTKETKMKAGDAHWHPADKHAVTNIGETAAHYLIFEFKK
jgi:quercetin dioxygenase-like cupin family protein